MASEILSRTRSVIVNEPAGAFYLSVVFKEELHPEMKLHIENEDVRQYVNSLCAADIQPDRRFVYQLLGSRHICTVPLSSFVSAVQGFRCTLLEQDEEKFRRIYKDIAEAADEFAASVLSRA